MNEHLHNIDKIFKNALEKFEEDPSSDVWQGIDKKLDNKKVVSISKKYQKLKWVASFLLLFSIAMAMYILQVVKKNKLLLQKNHPEVVLRDQKNEVNNGKELADTTKSVLQDNVSTQETVRPQKLGSKNDSDQSTFGENNKKLFESPLKNSRKESDLVKPAFIPQDFSSKQKNLNPSPTGSGSINNQQINAGNRIEDESNKIISTNDKNIAGSRLFPQHLSIPLAGDVINSDMISLKSFNKVNPNPVNLKAIPSKTHITIPSPTTSFFATIFFSPDIVKYNIQDDDDPPFEEDRRSEIKKNENLQFANSFGILGGYNINKTWIIQTGIMVSKSVTRIDSKTVYARPDRNGHINFRLSSFTGPSYIPLKSGGNPVDGDSTSLSAKNTLQYVSTPVVLQYRISRGRFSMNPGIGIAANFLVLNKIESEINTANGVQNSSGNSNGLRSAYLNGLINLNAAYKLNGKISISFSPGTRFGLTSINRDAHRKTTINSFAFQTGINIAL
jgi:hypothetical protein